MRKDPKPDWSYQRDAIESIKRDFNSNPEGQYILVIPTAGGKTRTAVNALIEMFIDGQLDRERDRILWTAHTQELIRQAREEFIARMGDYGVELAMDSTILIAMKGEAANILASDPSIKLLVIDEAHHAAAPTYQPLLSAPDLGVLGLTATPNRTDFKELKFERETFSIGFPDLIARNVILRPEVIAIEGGNYPISSFSAEELDQLNNSIRNRRIIDAILKNADKLHKIIIFAATKEHVISLYTMLCESGLNSQYESISWILGGGKNNRGESRDEFIAKEKTFGRSITVNADVLTEGYNDPFVNAVIMANPTDSRLRYMQCVGRAVRKNPLQPQKKAFVVEIHDKLPNISYLIDNRMLYMDIDDSLEPEVVDFQYQDESGFVEAIKEINSRFNVPAEFELTPNFRIGSRYSVLLFKFFKGAGDHPHLPLLLDNENRQKIIRFYNFMASRIELSAKTNEDFNRAIKIASQAVEIPRLTDSQKRYLFDAMKNSFEITQLPKQARGADMFGQLAPWISYAVLSHRPSEERFSEKLLDFISDMSNREEVVSILSSDTHEDSWLLRLPHPLEGSWGIFVSDAQLQIVDDVMGRIRALREQALEDQEEGVARILGNARLPFEAKRYQALIFIERDSVEYKYKIKKEERL